MTIQSDMNDAIAALKASDAKLRDQVTVAIDLIKKLIAGQGDPEVTAAAEAGLAALKDAQAENSADSAALQTVLETQASGSAPNA